MTLKFFNHYVIINLFYIIIALFFSILIYKLENLGSINLIFSSLYWWVTWFLLRPFIGLLNIGLLIICIFILNLIITYIYSYILFNKDLKKIYIITLLFSIITSFFWYILFWVMLSA